MLKGAEVDYSRKVCCESVVFRLRLSGAQKGARRLREEPKDGRDEMMAGLDTQMHMLQPSIAKGRRVCDVMGVCGAPQSAQTCTVGAHRIFDQDKNVYDNYRTSRESKHSGDLAYTTKTA